MRTETTEHAQSPGCRSCEAASTTSMPPSFTSSPNASNSPSESANSKPTMVCPRPTSLGKPGRSPGCENSPRSPISTRSSQRSSSRSSSPRSSAGTSASRSHAKAESKRRRQSPATGGGGREMAHIGQVFHSSKGDGFAVAVHSRLGLIVGARDAPRLVIPLNGMSAGRVLRQPRDNRRSFVFNRKRVRPWSMPSSAPEATRKR
jgi:hypothetical protein